MRKENTMEQHDSTEAPLCGCCRRVPLSYLSLDIDEPLVGWTSFFAARGIEVASDHLGRASVPRYVLADLLDKQREREVRLLEEAAAQQAPVVTPHGIPAREDLSAYEVMMLADGVSPVEEFGRIPPPHFLLEQLEEGARRQAAEREAARRKEAQ
jgi:hypothetical protein